MITLLAMTALSIQFEAGVNHMQQGQDDLYYDEQRSHSIQFTTPVYGVGLKFETHDVQLTVGYRDLGHQYISSDVLQDSEYFHCRDVSHNCASYRPEEQWSVHMHTQQEYVELGYAFHAGKYRIVPSLGMAINQERIDLDIANVDGYGYHGPPHITGGSQRNTAPFGGLSVQRGNFGVGAFILTTRPTPVFNHTLADWYPGTGNTSYLLRATYSFNLIGGAK
jgi:hypothetical protein